MYQKPATKKLFAISIVSLLATFSLGILAARLFFYERLPHQFDRQMSYNANNYKFTASEPGQQEQFQESTDLKNQLAKIIQDNIAAKQITNASVYFKNLNSGAWTDVNPKMQYSPGIILKVPLMMAYFKAAENDPKILTKMIVYRNTQPTLVDPKSESLVEGKQYTISELIDAMIKSNDDVAMFILFDNIDSAPLNDVYSDLGLYFLEDKINADFITNKSYSLIYKNLYGSSYLQRSGSEEALNTLSETNQTQGIALGLPINTTVSHLYNSRKFTYKNEPITEYNDCGIVYSPNSKVLLCVAFITKNLNREQISNQFFTQINSAIANFVSSK